MFRLYYLYSKFCYSAAIGNEYLGCSVENFLELEEIPAIKHCTDEDSACETHFPSTISRKSSVVIKYFSFSR